MKRALRNTLLILTTLITLVGCREEPDEPKWVRPPYQEVADQTVLMYLSGQSLISHFRRNIEEARQAVDEHILYNSRLLVYVQPNNRQSLLMELSFDYDKQSSRTDTLRRYEEQSSIDPEHIAQVLGDVAELAPAERYGMILGSHGGGWVKSRWSDLTLSETGSDEGMEDEWMQLHGRREVNFDWLHKSPGAEPTRWFGEHKGITTNISNWAEAFERAPIRMEYLIFDACFMSNIEALYELRHATNYIVASPCEIMGRGTNYRLSLPPLFSDKGENYDLEGFCRSFYDFYSTTTETRQSGCIALTLCEELEPLAEVTRRVLATRNDEADLSLLQSYEGLNSHLFFDFREYVEAVATDSELLAAFEEQFERTFPASCRLHTPGFYSGYNEAMNPIDYYSGVTTSAPSTKYPTDYATTPWYHAVYAQ